MPDQPRRMTNVTITNSKFYDTGKDVITSNVPLEVTMTDSLVERVGGSIVNIQPVADTPAPPQGSKPATVFVFLKGLWVWCTAIGTNVIAAIARAFLGLK